MSRLRLTYAGGDYDRTRALEEGTVRPDGIDLTFVRLPVEETFFRMLRHREFDAAEMSLSSYVVSLGQSPAPFVALPIFPSRAFRHSCIYVHRDAGFSEPRDLRGRVVGSPEYQLTACVWIRGILAEHHGLPIDAVAYRTGGLEQAGRIEKAPLRLPQRIDLQHVNGTRTLSQMLLDGEIDAIYTPRAPRAFLERDPRIVRLFRDPVAAEKAYLAATGIFPVMHVVVIRREIHEAHPWVAQSLTKAFLRAKEEALGRLRDSSAMSVMLPWLNHHLEEAEQLLGADHWSYGLPANRDQLATFLGYHHEQGLSERRFEPEELFAPSSLEAALI